MNELDIARELKGIRITVEEDSGKGISQLMIPAAALLEKVCRAFGLGDDEVAEVLGEVVLDESSIVTIPILGTITGGEEDQEVWERVADFFGRQRGCEG